jgi:hypothetical protein
LSLTTKKKNSASSNGPSLPLTQQLAQALILCIDHLDNLGTTDNIYSGEGSHPEVESLQKHVLKGSLTEKVLSQTTNPSSVARCTKNIISRLEPPLLAAHFIPKIMELHPDIEGLLSQMPELQHNLLIKFLTHICDIVDSADNNAVTFHDLALSTGTELFGSDHGVSAKSDSGAALVGAVEKLLAFRSHVMHGRPASSFESKFGSRMSLVSPPNAEHSNPSNDESIVESILDRSVKISFPKKKKGGDVEDSQSNPTQHESQIRTLLNTFDDVINVCYNDLVCYGAGL